MTGKLPGPIYLTGPTASGKSAVALELARLLDGEIISVDSMQVYRGLDLGTAKPSPEERGAIPHHLVDVVGINESFDVARFVGLAEAAEREIRARRRAPIYCGGTGLYFKALLQGLGDAPPSDPVVRDELEKTPIENLLTELAAKDPVTFDRIDRANPRRLVRALEVIRVSGRPFSEQRSSWAAGAGGPAGAIFVALQREPTDLRARIDARVDAIFAAGLVEETRSLLERGLGDNRTALQAIGYRQVVEHLRGERGLAATVTLVKSRTWQFARRQLTWLRGQLQPRWVPVAADADPVRIAEAILHDGLYTNSSPSIAKLAQ